MSYLPPPRNEGEPLDAYLDRLEWHRNRIPKDVRTAPIKGFVGDASGFVPWRKADYIGPVGGEQKENPASFRSFHVDIEAAPIRKRSGLERMDEIRSMLIALAAQSYIDGVLRLPTSILNKLVALGVYEKLEDANKDTVEDVTRKFDIYAAALLAAAPSKDLTPQVSATSTLDVAV